MVQMNFKFRYINIFLISILLIAFIVPLSVAGNYEKTYTIQTPSKLVNHEYSLTAPQLGILTKLSNQKLYVSIQPSLLNYYGNLTHAVNDDNDYAQFVTPQAVAPIAQAIQKVTANLPNSEEQFADVTLALVHQIPYNVTNAQYPVETLVDNYGDCVGLSILAASIMEAGGLDVVLIHYTGINPQHMNVGVYLPYTPAYHTTLMTPTSFTYDNKTYWTAEATPAGDWRVGDQSMDLAAAKVNIIPLEKNVQSPAGQVSARLNTDLLSSAVTVNVSEDQASNQDNSTRDLLISGSISPTYSGQPVSICINNDGVPTYFSGID